MAAAFDLLVFVLVAGAVAGAGAQSPAPASGTPGTNPDFRSSKLNPSMAIIIVLLISAFFFLGFFSVYLRQCSRGNSDSFTIAAAAAAAAIGRARGQRGLDRAVLETFPILIYSEVKEHKIGKGALECAICLNEFEDEEAIRLLPKCDHVFHHDCIDAWLETHVTCPVCRTNYAVDFEYPEAATALNGEAMALPEADPPQPPPASEEEERKELERIASRVRRSRRISRSYSTGHSIDLKKDRFTLKLPENVRKEIIAAGKLQRARTFTASGPVDPSSLRRGRTVRLGRSDRWPSFFRRSFSAKITAWGGFKSFSRKPSGVKNPIDDPAESSAAALDRV